MVYYQADLKIDDFIILHQRNRLPHYRIICLIKQVKKRYPQVQPFAPVCGAGKLFNIVEPAVRISFLPGTG
jgi:hypothetical protein